MGLRFVRAPREVSSVGYTHVNGENKAICLVASVRWLPLKNPSTRVLENSRTQERAFQLVSGGAKRLRLSEHVDVTSRARHRSLRG